MLPHKNGHDLSSMHLSENFEINGYYGYVKLEQTEQMGNKHQETLSLSSHNGTNFHENPESLNENGQFTNRKRVRDDHHSEAPNFKKKRESKDDFNSKNLEEKNCFDVTSGVDSSLLEEMLMKTHGSSFYHWCDSGL